MSGWGQGAGGGGSTAKKKSSGGGWGQGSGASRSAAAPTVDEDADKPFLAKALDTALDVVGKPVSKAFDILDTPRAAVVSTVQELDDLTEGRGFSGGDWVDQTARNMGVGEFIENSDTDIDNLWVKRGLGLVGDVALDPLTYVTGGAHKVASEGGKATRLSYKEVAKTLARDGDKELADQVLKKRTAAVLPDEVKERLGVETGLMAGVGKTKGIIPGTKNIGIHRANLTNPAIDWAGRTRIGSATSGWFDTHKAFAKMKTQKNGDAMVAASADIISRARTQGDGFRQAADSGLGQIVKRHKKVDGPAVVHEMEVPGSAADPDIVEAAEEMSAWQADVRAKANAALQQLDAKNPDGTPLQIGFIENYVPRQASDEFREVLKTHSIRSATKAGAGKASLEKARVRGVVGESWFGKVLTEEDANIRGMNAIAAEAMGVSEDEAFRIFKDDPWAIGRAYASSVANIVQREAMHSGLRQAGLEKFFTDGANVKGLKKLPKKEAQAAALHKQVSEESADAAKARQKELAYLRKHRAELDQAEVAKSEFEAVVAAQSPIISQIEANLALNPVPATKRKLEDELSWRLDAVEVAEEALDQTEGPLKEALRLEAVANAHTANAIAKRQKALTVEESVKKIKQRQAEFQSMVDEGLRSIEGDPQRWVNPAVADLITEVKNWNTPTNNNAFLRTYDGIISRWKAQALLSPGFHMRNFFGGAFNNALAEVDIKSYYKFEQGVRQMKRAKGDISAIKDPKVREAFEAMEKYPIFGGTDLRDFADVGLMNTGRAGLVSRGVRAAGREVSPLVDRFDPTSLDFKPYTMNRKVGEGVEKLLRGPLFVDRITKGFSPEDALEAVFKYHFDYSDLAKWEGEWGRRIMPFYTWTRKNLPLQLEGMVSRPGIYTRYLHIKRNLELGQEEEIENEARPDYYERAMAIRSGKYTSGKGFWGGSGEDPIYTMPDLPFIGLDETLDPNTLASSVTPAVKTPLEIFTNRSFFTGNEIEPSWAEKDKMPKAWGPIGEFLAQFDGKFGFPKVEKDEDGDWVIGRKGSYLIEQAVPAMGRARRLAPSEKHMRDRVLSNYLSTLFGVNARTLTEYEQKAERDRRAGGS